MNTRTSVIFRSVNSGTKNFTKARKLLKSMNASPVCLET